MVPFQTQGVAEGHVWVHSPAATRVYVDSCSSCCLQRTFIRRLGSGLQPVASLVSKSLAAEGAMLMCTVCAATQGNGIVQALTAARGHVWVHDPDTAGIWGSLLPQGSVKTMHDEIRGPG